jgi:hypothetical protein
VAHQHDHPDRKRPAMRRFDTEARERFTGLRLRRLGPAGNGSRFRASLNLQSPDVRGRPAMPRQNELAPRPPRLGEVGVAEDGVRWTRRVTGLDEDFLTRARRCTAAPISPESPTDPQPARAPTACWVRWPGGAALGQGARSAPMPRGARRAFLARRRGSGKLWPSPMASVRITPHGAKNSRSFLNSFPFSSMVYSS